MPDEAQAILNSEGYNHEVASAMRDAARIAKVGIGADPKLLDAARRYETRHCAIFKECAMTHCEGAVWCRIYNPGGSHGYTGDAYRHLGKRAHDEATFQRGVGLYESGKVTEVEEFGEHYSAIVQGTKPYRVSVSSRRYKDAHCTCYLGERGTLCKHVVALALHAVMDGKPLKEEEKQQVVEMKCSDKRDPLNKDELEAVKKAITESMRCIKPYSGQNMVWESGLTSGGM